MSFKLDENLGRGAWSAFAAAGHDVSSIHLQQLDGSADDRVFSVCRAESRVLVLERHDITGALWVVRGGPVRVWTTPTADE